MFGDELFFLRKMCRDTLKNYSKDFCIQLKALANHSIMKNQNQKWKEFEKCRVRKCKYIYRLNIFRLAMISFSNLCSWFWDGCAMKLIFNDLFTVASFGVSFKHCCVCILLWESWRIVGLVRNSLPFSGQECYIVKCQVRFCCRFCYLKIEFEINVQWYSPLRNCINKTNFYNEVIFVKFYLLVPYYCYTVDSSSPVWLSNFPWVQKISWNTKSHRVSTGHLWK